MKDFQFFLELEHYVPHRLMSIKCALIKLFHDKGFYFDVESRLEDIYDNFTLDNIISCWAEKTVHIYDETPLFLEDNVRARLTALVGNTTLSLEDEEPTILGQIYEKISDEPDVRSRKITSMPKEVSEFMTEILRQNAREFDRMFDPACGSGVFLEAFYDVLMGFCCNNDNENTIYESHRRIMSECIYGCDTSPVAVAISKIVLAMKYNKCILPEHIVCIDPLLSIPDEFKGFDWLVTNPPNVGYKYINNAYRKRIQKKYSVVYHDKADLSYCYFALAADVLRDKGNALFITGRYFAQSMYADKLRGYILDNYSLKLVIDFNGMRPFRYAAIDPMMMFMKKGQDDDNRFETIKFSPNEKFSMYTPFEYLQHTVTVDQDDLSEVGFNFLDEHQKGIVESIEGKCVMKLSDAGEFFQGVITGCDKAFVVEDGSLLFQACINECGVPFIKSSDIKDKGIDFGGKCLLYTNDAGDPEDIPFTIEKLEDYRTQLSQRRECRTGKRHWWELQWGRNKDLFLSPKIVFPYKSKRNLFKYDPKGYFFSADVYGFVPDEDHRDEKYVKGLEILLNSTYYDRYFKTFAKKLGGNMFEYYPNTVSRMMIPSYDDIASFESEEDVKNFFGL